MQELCRGLYRVYSETCKLLKKKKKFTKVFDSRVNLISLRSDIDFGNHPN